MAGDAAGRQGADAVLGNLGRGPGTVHSTRPQLAPIPPGIDQAAGEAAPAPLGINRHAQPRVGFLGHRLQCGQKIA